MSARVARGSTETYEQANIEQGGASCAAGGGARELPRTGWVCPPAAPPEPDRDHELDLADNDEVDKDAVIGR